MDFDNPFNPVTTIAYGIKEQSHVSLKIYNSWPGSSCGPSSMMPTHR